MKYHILLFLTLLIFAAPVSVKVSAEENNPAANSKIWNLLRDLNDYKAGRLRLWQSGRWSVVSSDKVTTVIGIPDDPDLFIDFGVSFPLPAVRHKEDIESILLEVEFKWPKSKGSIQFTFGNYVGLFFGTGIVFSYDTFPGISVGYLNALHDHTIKDRVKTYPIGTMGSKTHSLKILYNPGDELISVTFDNKEMSAPGTVKPRVLTFLGNEFDTFIISKMEMTVTLTK